MTHTLIAARAVAVAALLCMITPTAAQAVQGGDIVQQTRVVIKQGEEQLAQVRQQVRQENYSEAVRVLTQYRDAIKSAHAALKATGRNAEKKPGGFKNLQIHLRHSIRQLDQLILSLPPDERAPFDQVRKELDSVDKELIDALFPRQPSKKGDTKPGP
ncbi:MAG TPA: hypothetical protein VGQ11_05700 [Candidatus Acidoferrales bacterium]|jgi:nitrate/nitrite-specific signal transduction histidine kinase|nr:hypothetical protein [Candidatus Acidoferrales bacterium]